MCGGAGHWLHVLLLLLELDCPLRCRLFEVMMCDVFVLSLLQKRVGEASTIARSMDG